ncbi:MULTISPECIES: FUSC family protein [Sphingobacterium]|uniref:FUSC family membrane protein n=1 Tax=Sphingobacterium populi TaxID=1812824 RepID=A0ABW5UDI5_9SPHI|nr:FUSC family membrane protein [Sphingobacterium sp. CFCC 11742]
MKQSKEIKSFFYGQYFAEGLRITIGSIIPVLVCALLDHLFVGTLISLGALLVGLSDTPGPPHHRRTGMLACLGVCLFTFLLTISVNTSFILMGVVLALISFSYSMFGVFNARAATVGAMGILMMLIHIEGAYTLKEELQFILFFIIGAVWYMIVSYSFSSIQPYRLAQQELAESIRHVAEFLRLRANFYNVKTDYNQNYLKIIEKQIEVHKHQENVRELLFRSKRSIKDTTKLGRLLILVFNDIVDLFEQTMTTYYDYDAIRKMFNDTGVLHHFRYVVVKLTHELDHFAYQLNANQMPRPMHDFSKDIEHLRFKVEQIDKNYDRNTIPLKKVIVNIRKIAALIENMYNYSQINASSVVKEEIDDASKFIQTSHIDWKSFKSNLSKDSSIYRHAVRMAIVMTVSYFGMHFLNFSDKGSFWVLLTILVILKPGFGLTKERNVQRLMGTVIGGIVGALILVTIHNQIVLFILLIFFFLIAYSLFRINYILFVVFLTPYVLIMISFTGVNTFEMAKERIFDTFIGGMVAFISSYIIFPNWESTKIKETIYKLLVANFVYLEQVAKMFRDEPINITEYKLARKELYIASANMGSTLQRMLTEPKWRQKNTKDVNRFVVLNHIFFSYSASLFTEIDKSSNLHISNNQYDLLKRTTFNLYRLIQQFDEYEAPADWTANFQGSLVEDENHEDSKLITEQLQFLLKISNDLPAATYDAIKRDAIKYDKEMEAAHG